MMVLLKHFIRSSLSYRLKRKFLLSLFLYTSSYANSYLKNNFIEDKDSYILSGYVEAYSTKLPFNLFEKQWDLLPQRDSLNTNFATLNYDISYNNSNNIRFGMFREKSVNTIINDGFIDTWYDALQDFNVLLKKSSITTELDTVDIYAEGNFYDTSGLFVQKVISPYRYNYLSLKTKFYYGKEMQYINTVGYNNKSRFELDLEYYYTDDNIVTKNNYQDDIYNGYGYGFDLEYIYYDNIWYIYAGLLNIGANIYWNSITHIYYKFDSDTTYYDEDGYKHSRAFGNGYYEFDIDYKQKIPMYHKLSIDYKINEYLNIGNNLVGYKSANFNEPYIMINKNNHRVKFGYGIEVKNAVFGYYYKNIGIQLSNKIGSNQSNLITTYKITF